MAERDPRSSKSWFTRIGGKVQRKMRAQAEGEPSIYYGFGMFGLIGWAVAVPTLVGIALGVWIDDTWPSRYSWTLMLLVFGVALGCWNAWNWVKRSGGPYG